MNIFKNYKESPFVLNECAKANEVKSKKMRWHVLYKLIKENNYKKCLEIGTAQGWTAHSILLNTNDVTWTTIDPYKSYEEYSDGKNNIKILDSLKNQAYKSLSPFSDRWFNVEKFSDEAVHDIDDDYDLIFIDGNHSYDYVKKDIELFYPKLKKGGTLAGHDYKRPNNEHEGVTQAVNEFIDESQLTLFQGDNFVWFTEKE